MRARRPPGPILPILWAGALALLGVTDLPAARADASGFRDFDLPESEVTPLVGDLLLRMEARSRRTGSEPEIPAGLTVRSRAGFAVAPRAALLFQLFARDVLRYESAKDRVGLAEGDDLLVSLEKFGLSFAPWGEGTLRFFLGQSSVPVGLDVLLPDDAPGFTASDSAFLASRASAEKRATGIFFDLPADFVGPNHPGRFEGAVFESDHRLLQMGGYSDDSVVPVPDAAGLRFSQGICGGFTGVISGTRMARRDTWAESADDITHWETREAAGLVFEGAGATAFIEYIALRRSVILHGYRESVNPSETFTGRVLTAGVMLGLTDGLRLNAVAEHSTLRTMLAVGVERRLWRAGAVQFGVRHSKDRSDHRTVTSLEVSLSVYLGGRSSYRDRFGPSPD